MRKAMIAYLVSLAILLSACGARPEDSPDIEETEEPAVVSEDVQDGSNSIEGAVVGYDIHMLKYMLFIPSDFDVLYGGGIDYEGALDDWASLEFPSAETKLLKAEDIIENSGNTQHPEDIAFVRESIGCLYLDTADYDKAYDYLIDAYVTMQELYGTDGFYTNAVSLALCRYYYCVGDYEGCLREVNRLRDDNASASGEANESGYLSLFISYTLNDIEASIKMDRGEYNDAYALYKSNLELCDNYRDAEGDGFDRNLETDLFIKVADLYAVFISESKMASQAVDCYDFAIQLCDSYTGDFARQMKSLALVKKGKFLTSFQGKAEEGIDILTQGLDIQVELYAEGKADPSYVFIECTNGDILGFIVGNKEEALYAYGQALDYAIDIYGQNHPETARVYECLGRFYGNRMGDIDQAITYYEKGIEVFRNLLIENNKMAAQIHLGLAGCYRSIGNEEVCTENLDKAYAIYDKLGIHILTRNEIGDNDQEE